MGVGSSDILVVIEAGCVEATISSSLSSSGYTVHIVVAANDCLSALEKYSPQAILISVDSDSIDPASLLSCIREKCDAPVILMRDKDHSYQTVPLLQQGAVDYVAVDDADSPLLSNVVERAITQRRNAIQQKENERRLSVLEQDQRAGSRVQSNFLPASPCEMGGFCLSHYVKPSLILSGDSVNYFPLGESKVLFYLADVSGHGAAAAIVSVTLMALSRRLEHEFPGLGLDTSSAVLSWYNRELLQLDLEHHVTMFLGILDGVSNTLQYSNAAHFPAAILQQEKQSVYLELGGLPLGVCETDYDFLEAKVAETFNLVMFSDGVLEIMDKTTIKEKEQDLLSLVQCGNTEIDALVKHLGLDVKEEVPDDIAVFTIARKN